MIPIWGLIFHVTTKLLRVIIRPLTPPPSQIIFVENVLVGHVKGLFQTRESPFPLNPTKIMRDALDNLMCFLNGPLQIIEHQIIPLTPYYLRKTAPQE
jgi:hypothetical protein